MAHSPHRRWKGCYCCKPHKHRDAGQGVRKTVQERRQLGRNRRLRRHELGS